MDIKWENISNQVIWDLVIKNGLRELTEDMRMEVFYDVDTDYLFAAILIDGIHLEFDESKHITFIYSFDNLERYWKKKRDEISIDEDLKKQLENDKEAWEDYVLKLYTEDWMQVKLPEDLETV